MSDGGAASTLGPGPVIHPEIAPFWEAVAAGTFVLPHCTACDAIRFPVTSICPNCLSTATSWQAASPRGRVRTAIVVERTERSSRWDGTTPFLTGLVDLDAGVRMPGRLLCDCGGVEATGAVVRLVTTESADGNPMFAFAHTCRLPSDA